MGPALMADQLPPLTTVRMITGWEFDPIVVALLAVVAGLYVLGVARLLRRGDRWPGWRTAAFLAGGLGTITVATSSAIGAYDDTLFWIHVLQHLILSMISPVFLGLGAPITLGLRSLPLLGRRRLLAILHSGPVRIATHPLVSVPLFVGTLYGLYFTGLYDLTLRNNTAHDLLHLHFVLVGCLFLWPLVGMDPIPNRLPYYWRMMVMFVTLPLHAWLGVVVMSSRTLIAGGYYAGLHRSWGPSLQADQRLGGGLLWVAGDVVGLLYFGVLFGQWIRADAREARRLDRRADLLLDQGRATVAGRRPARAVADPLAAYNAWLVALDERDRQR